MDSADQKEVFDTVIPLLNTHLRTGSAGTSDQGDIRLAYDLLAASKPDGKITDADNFPNNELRNALQHIADALLETKSLSEAQLSCARALRHFLHARRDIHVLTNVSWRTRIHSNILHLENLAHDNTSSQLWEYRVDLGQIVDEVKKLKIPRCDKRGPIALIEADIRILEENCASLLQIIEKFTDLHKRMCDRYRVLKTRKSAPIIWAKFARWRWQHEIWKGLVIAVTGGVIVNILVFGWHDFVVSIEQIFGDLRALASSVHQHVTNLFPHRLS